VPHGRYLLPHEGVPQGLAATYTCSGITAFSALKKTRGHLGADDHLVIIGAGVGGSAAHRPAAVDGKIIVADIACPAGEPARCGARSSTRGTRRRQADGGDRRRRRGDDFVGRPRR
jgi:D-arabinose 1-dehydrogenase-like Zn-dependent alcohol dehydrogenase